MHVALNLSLAGLHTSSCSVATRCAHFTFESSKISLGRYYKVPMCLRTTSLASLNVRNVISLVLFSLSPGISLGFAREERAWVKSNCLSCLLCTCIVTSSQRVIRKETSFGLFFPPHPQNTISEKS